MTPKEEAIGLVREFYNITEQEGYHEEFEEAKKCALICVNRILDIYELDEYAHWRKVKQEIIKLEKL